MEGQETGRMWPLLDFSKATRGTYYELIVKSNFSRPTLGSSHLTTRTSLLLPEQRQSGQGWDLLDTRREEHNEALAHPSSTTVRSRGVIP